MGLQINECYYLYRVGSSIGLITIVVMTFLLCFHIPAKRGVWWNIPKRVRDRTNQVVCEILGTPFPIDRCRRGRCPSRGVAGQNQDGWCVSFVFRFRVDSHVQA